MGIGHAMTGFMLAGVSLEVFWTSIANYWKNKDIALTGRSYLWVFPVYAVAALIYLVATPLLQNTPLIVRVMVYVLAFYLLEYVSGLLLRISIGRCPWDYSQKQITVFGKTYTTHLHGIICLDYLPIWLLYAILGEQYFLFLITL